jgi:hypothetical protein
MGWKGNDNILHKIIIFCYQLIFRYFALSSGALERFQGKVFRQDSFSKAAKKINFN